MDGGKGTWMEVIKGTWMEVRGHGTVKAIQMEVYMY